MGEEAHNRWRDAFVAVAHELGMESFDSVDDVLAAARKLRVERDVSMGESTLDAAASALADLRAENARLTRDLRSGE